MNKHVMDCVDLDDGGSRVCRGCRQYVYGNLTETPPGECPAPYKPTKKLLAESLAREEDLKRELAMWKAKHANLAERDALLQSLWTCLSSSELLIRRYVPDHSWLPRIAQEIAKIKAVLSDSVGPATPTTHRLLQVGEKTLASDQFLGDDADTWYPMTECPIFIGRAYHHGLQPVRRSVPTGSEGGAE